MVLYYIILFIFHKFLKGYWYYLNCYFLCHRLIITTNTLQCFTLKHPIYFNVFIFIQLKVISDSSNKSFLYIPYLEFHSLISYSGTFHVLFYY